MVLSFPTIVQVDIGADAIYISWSYSFRDQKTLEIYVFGKHTYGIIDNKDGTITFYSWEKMFGSYVAANPGEFQNTLQNVVVASFYGVNCLQKVYSRDGYLDATNIATAGCAKIRF